MNLLTLEGVPVSPPLTTQEFLTWITIIGSAVGILAVFGRGIKDAITSWFTNKHQSASVDVEKLKVHVTEKEADSHHLQIIFEGMTASIEALSKRADAAEQRADSAHERVDALKRQLDDRDERVDALQTQLNRRDAVQNELIDHIQVLEAGYPNPPGPPKRPLWQLKHKE